MPHCSYSGSNLEWRVSLALCEKQTHEAVWLALHRDCALAAGFSASQLWRYVDEDTLITRALDEDRKWTRVSSEDSCTHKERRPRVHERPTTTPCWRQEAVDAAVRAVLAAAAGREPEYVHVERCQLRDPFDSV